MIGDVAKEAPLNAGMDLPFALAMPHASALLESLGDLRYLAWAAAADLVGNSIAADAIRIRILVRRTPLRGRVRGD